MSGCARRVAPSAPQKLRCVGRSRAPSRRALLGRCRHLPGRLEASCARLRLRFDPRRCRSSAGCPAPSPRSGRPTVLRHRSAFAVVVRRPVPLATQTCIAIPAGVATLGAASGSRGACVRDRRRSPEGPHHHGSGLAPPPAWSRRSPRFGWQFTLPEGTLPSSGRSVFRDPRYDGSSRSRRGGLVQACDAPMVGPRRDLP